MLTRRRPLEEECSLTLLGQVRLDEARHIGEGLELPGSRQSANAYAIRQRRTLPEVLGGRVASPE